MNPAKKTIKIQVHIPEDFLKELQGKMSGDKTKNVDLVTNGLVLLKTYFDERARGWKICTVDEEHKLFREILLPALAG